MSERPAADVPRRDVEPGPDGSGPDGPQPDGPKDAALADPPSGESAESDQPHRTPGLGNTLAAPARDTTIASEEKR